MKYGLGAVASIVVVAAIVFAVASSSGGGGEGQQAQGYEFSMFQDIEEVGFRDGNLAELEGKPLVLNFWAGLCPPCRAEMPQFQVFYEEFKDQIQLVGIDIGVFAGLGSRNAVAALLRELGVTQLAGLRTAVSPQIWGYGYANDSFYQLRRHDRGEERRRNRC